MDESAVVIEQNDGSWSADNLSADEGVVEDPKLWRTGPASHIYDLLGIPEDSQNLNYNTVLQPQDLLDPPAPTVAVEKQHQLELAIQSILPNNKDSSTSADDLGIPPWKYELDHDERQHSSPWIQASTASDQVPPSTDANLESENQRLKKLVFQLEEVEAASTLVQKMTDVDEYESFYSNRTSNQTGEAISGQFEDGSTYNNDFSLVAQVQWENDIIWDMDIPVAAQANNIKEKQARAGWIPSLRNRKANTESSQRNIPSYSFKSILSYENKDLVNGSWEKDIIWNVNEFRNQLPLPQPKMPVFDKADEDIVFEMPSDFLKHDDAGEDQQPITTSKRAPVQPHTSKSKRILRKTGFILSTEKTEPQVTEVMRSSSGAGSASARNKDLFDWAIAIASHSNDEFYLPKETSLTKDGSDCKTCIHSRLIREMRPPFILTHLSDEQLRNFHRPKLSATVNAPSPTGRDPNRHYFKSLSKRIKMKQEEHEKLMSKGAEILFDKEIDLSARDGTIILVENSEEHPPLLSQVGMCSQIVNYYKRKSANLENDDSLPPVPHVYGETKYASGSSIYPFLGTIENGQVLSSICNNMYHAPIYWHGSNETDFLVLRTKMSGYLIRDLDGLFVAGQQCPIIEVPEPNSVKFKNFIKDLVQAFVYRKYIACRPPVEGTKNSTIADSNPVTEKVRIDLIIQHFPSLLEANIKAFLKNSSEIKRIGNTSWMVMKPGFSIPCMEEIAEMVTPEQVCAYYSLMAAQHRLKDAGLDSMLALPEKSHDDLDGKKSKKPHCGMLEGTTGRKSNNHQFPQSAFDEELLSAPWNTTSAFIAALNGKCLLQVTGPADPTGCGEGFSYIRVPKRSAVVVSSNGMVERTSQYSGRGRPRKNLPKTGGTDADLRKLSAKTAKDLLRKVGVPEKEVQKLSRWEVIDLVRTLSTEKVMQGEMVDKAITKYCRWKTFHSAAMNQERYKEACQRVFELQNKVLSSRECLSTDDEDSDDDEDGVVGTKATRRAGTSQKDIEMMGKNIERILCGDADIDRLTHEEEELERLELQKMMLGGIMAKDADIAKRKEELEQQKDLAQKNKTNTKDILTDLVKHPGKVLKLTRTFKDIDNGESFVRTEIVRDPEVIAVYLQIRNSKSEEYIKNFLSKAERREKKEQKQKERILLGKLKDMAHMEERKLSKEQYKRKLEIEDEYFPNKVAKKTAEKALRRRSRKCGACGMPGHMRTSKDCPMYNEEKIDKILKKQENKRLKVSVNTTPQPSHSLQETGTAPKDFGSDTTGTSDSSEDSDTSSSDEDTVSEKDSEMENEFDWSQSTPSPVSSQEVPIVKTDGLKMFVKKSSIQEMINQAQDQEAKEQEVARILATMSMANSSTPGSATARGRRVSQAERENADYLMDRKYKTTAADRRSARF